MSAAPDIKTLLNEIKAARQAVETRDGQTQERVAELESSINEILLGMRRPGGDGGYGDGAIERKDAWQMCMDRHSWEVQKMEGRDVGYTPSSDEIESAIIAQKAWRKIIRHGRLERLDHEEQKSLSAFSFGGSASCMSPPEVSSRILSCLTDETDFMSLLSHSVSL